MRRDEPAEGSRDNVNVEEAEREHKAGEDDFKSKVDLPGKTDSGPEPDVFGREIPPQD